MTSGGRGIDGAFEALVAELPRGLATEARALVAGLPGGCWAGYVQLEPFQELPIFAAEDPDVPGRLLLEGTELERHRAAHYFGGFWGVAADRLADGQHPHSAAAEALVVTLRGSWCDALARAGGDAGAASGAVSAAERRWRSGTTRERQARLSGEALPFAEYAGIIRDKTAWLVVAAAVVAARVTSPDRAREFEALVEQLCLASQCLDDAQDAEEDRSNLGVDTPMLLRLPAGALAYAALPVLASAARRARAARFHGLARWLARHAAAVGAPSAPIRPAERIGGWLLAAELGAAAPGATIGS